MEKILQAYEKKKLTKFKYLVFNSKTDYYQTLVMQSCLLAQHLIEELAVNLPLIVL